MLENKEQEKTIARNHRRWLPITALTLASITTAILCLPSSADTVVRKIYMNNDGMTETTTTTTTTQQTALPQVLGVDRVVLPSAPVTVSDSVLVPTTTVQRVVVPTSTVSNVVVDAAVYKSALQARQNRLRAVIAANIANGTLTAQSAARYRAELDRLAAAELALDSNRQLSYERVLPLAYEYDLIGSELKVVDLQPIVQGSRFVLSDTHVFPIDDLMRRRAGLEAKISLQLASGNLSVSEADRLRSMLNHVAVIESGMRGDGQISDREAKDLYAEFDKIGSAIDKAL
jgi:hypothetical protein